MKLYIFSLFFSVLAIILNIFNYDLFLKEVCSVYEKMYDILKDGAYLVIIVKNVKKGGKMYPLAWDMARILSKKYVNNNLLYNRTDCLPYFRAAGELAVPCTCNPL